MTRSNEQLAGFEDPNVVSIVDDVSPFAEVWDAFVDLFGMPTSPMRALFARTVRELADQGATYDEVFRRAQEMVAEWGPSSCTPMSLLKWWNRYGGESAIASIDEAALERHRSSERMKRLEGGD